jgi:type II secretory pathway pseudopilin PulG
MLRVVIPAMPMPTYLPVLHHKEMIMRHRCINGFTLVEVAVLLAIIGLLITGMMKPLSAQMDMRANLETHARLTNASDTLLGYAMANGRLPCPASSTSNGVEDPVGGGVCNHPYDGFLPAVTLGLPNVDNQGYALDGWGSHPVNRLRYAVTAANANAFTTTNSIKSSGLGTLSPNLYVCAGSGGIVTPATNCGTATILTSSAVAVIFSAGKNATTGGASPDESKNYDNDRVFVSHMPTANPNEFDDVVTWIAPGLLYSRMVAAGQLP